MAKRIKGLSLIGRFDQYDPNTSVDGDEIIRTLIGLGYRVCENISVAVDYQTSQTGTGPTSKTGFLHGDVSF